MARTWCQEIQANLEELVHSSCGGEALPDLEAHLADCAACRQLVSTCRRNARDLQRLTRLSAPAGGLERIWERLVAQEEAAPAGNAARLGALSRAEAPEVDLHDPQLAGRFARLAHRTAPAALDRAVHTALADFLRGRTRPGRVLRILAGGMAAAASLLLCLTMWLQEVKSSAPEKGTMRFVYQDVSTPLAGWAGLEGDQTGVGRAGVRHEGRPR